MEWLEASVVVEPEAAEAVAEVLSRYAPQGVAIDLGLGQGKGPVTVRAYLAVDETIEDRRQKVEEALWHMGQILPIPAPSFQLVPDQDWTATWRESIPTLHLGKQVVIKPTWRTYDPAPGEIVLEMDPGMAFGTGLHATTQLCIEALETQIRPGQRVLDLGTGTGILALAAARLGAGPVLAVDNDENAVIVARQNVEHNSAGTAIELLFGSLADAPGPYDMILANILAPVIIAMAGEGLGERLASGGVLIASGILAEQADAVTAALTAGGLTVQEKLQRGDWVALIAVR